MDKTNLNLLWISLLVQELARRAAAFHALGSARATARPAVLVCTSDSAMAHYFSAIWSERTEPYTRSLIASAGLDYHAPATLSDFMHVWKCCRQHGCPTLIEVITERSASLTCQRQMQQELALLLEPVGSRVL